MSKTTKTDKPKVDHASLEILKAQKQAAISQNKIVTKNGTDNTGKPKG